MTIAERPKGNLSVLAQKITMIARIPSVLRFIFFASVFLSFSNAQLIIAQTIVSATKEKILPPVEENFEEVDALATPWRDSGCRPLDRLYLDGEMTCDIRTGPNYKFADTLTLYNADGTLWYRFSLTYEKPDYFMRDTKMNFVPFSMGGHSNSPQKVILRMVGESSHWYKVEVNETTRAMKFILKSDPMWSKTTWEYWIGYTNLMIDPEEVKLLDKPDGKVVEEAVTWSWTAKRGVKLLKIDGDWAFVKTVIGDEYKGWIRWRNGRNLLVGGVLTAFEIPQIKTEESK